MRMHKPGDTVMIKNHLVNKKYAGKTATVIEFYGRNSYLVSVIMWKFWFLKCCKITSVDENEIGKFEREIC